MTISSGGKSGVPNKPHDKRRLVGKYGEQLAADKLLEAGYTILHRGWSCSRGELDIVAIDSGQLVFVEVRTKSAGSLFGTAAESVDRRKQQQVRKLAAIYCQQQHREDCLIRFDVIAITLSRDTEDVVHYEHICDAF